ncbi:hypothetical protein BS50DRAFT_569038 [Corynespora cassiicola Philippines]|uniref:Luciferase domain-containing protein n=1 Tax=Corynespora cassiicola Philippines TaxID=1448308 RepID=A0A2T2P758_CORCC|nr:hypothetical protein BS50DRAFT_569038 [Corynespora cassiicola Philippines]
MDSPGALAQLKLAAALACAAVSLTGLTFWADFRSWKQFGTGGTPPTLKGYIKIRRWGLYLLFKRQNLLDVSPIPDEGASYLDAESIPVREGSRPSLTRWTLPQRQHPTPISTKTTSYLDNLMQDFATSSTFSPYITSGPSKTEGGTGHAVYIRPEVDTINPNAHKIFYEVAHVHPTDHSLHVYASTKDARLVIEKGWGARFPVEWLAPSSWIMVYAPRDDGEAKVVNDIVRAAVCFAAGKDIKE